MSSILTECSVCIRLRWRDMSIIICPWEIRAHTALQGNEGQLREIIGKITGLLYCRPYQRIAVHCRAFVVTEG
jgi:hypothetical protein